MNETTARTPSRHSKQTKMWPAIVVVAVSVFSVLSVDTRASWADLGDCSQPVTSGTKQTATDCLFILRAGVGAATCAPKCICDTDSNGNITAGDALRCLIDTVGGNATVNCPCDNPTTTSTTTSSTTSSTTTTTVPSRVDTTVYDQACVEVTFDAGGNTTTVRSPGTLTVAVDLASIGDADSDGLDEVTVEVIEASVVATDPALGTITIVLSDENIHPAIDQRSFGVLEENQNLTPGELDLPPYAASGSAAMRLELFLQATSDSILVPGRAHIDTPLILEGTVSANPPAPGDVLVMQNDQPIALLNDSDALFTILGNTLTIDLSDLASVDLNAASCE